MKLLIKFILKRKNNMPAETDLKYFIEYKMIPNIKNQGWV